MEDLHINEREEDRRTSPKVSCDFNAGTIKISGWSFMENTGKFYKPIFNWLSEFMENENRPLHLILELKYLNSSSQKIFFDIFDKLKTYQDDGKAVKAEWHFEDFDEETEEDIDYIIEETGFWIEKKPKSIIY